MSFQGLEIMQMHFNCPLIAVIQRSGWGGEGISGVVLFQIKSVPSNLLCPFVCDSLAVASLSFFFSHKGTGGNVEGLLVGARISDVKDSRGC